MDSITPRKRVDLSLTPDINDPNFYCTVCDTTYKGKIKFRIHIRYTHNIVLPLERHPPKYDPNLIVYTTNPNSTSCGICRLTYKTKYTYKTHMERQTQLGLMEPVRGKSRMDANIIPDLGDPNNYCKSCKLSCKL
jgi:hypothetical protein